MNALLIMILIGTTVAGCNDKAQNDGANRRTGNDSEAGKLGKGNSKAGNDDGDKTDDGEDDGGGNGNDGGEGTTDTCNFKFSDKLASPVSAQGSAQAPLIGAISFDLKADASVSISTSTTKATVGLDAAITSFSPAIARSLADNVVNSYKDPLKLTVVPQNKLSAFYKNNPGWKGLDCVVVPVTKVVNDSYEYEFDPALPMIISPLLTEKALSDAIAGTVSIGNIKSKLIRHFQPESVAARGSYEGSATIKASNGTYIISYDFGTKAPEALATPMAGISFEPSSTKGKYDSVTITSFVSDDSKIDLKITK